MVKRINYLYYKTVMCPYCGKEVTNFDYHIMKHINEFIRKGIVQHSFFDFGIETREVWIYKNKTYISPKNLFFDVIKDV
ncbi:MAG: hypothetical protein QXW80_02805 [Candidatus Micrarchaeia archaeon]